MKEFLILRNTRELYCIDSTDMWYIEAIHNRSNFYLTNGYCFTLTMQLGKVAEAIDEYLPHHNDFRRIGQSLIININYLFHINLTEQQLELYNKQNKNGITLKAGKESLKKLKEELEKKKGK